MMTPTCFLLAAAVASFAPEEIAVYGLVIKWNSVHISEREELQDCSERLYDIAANW